MTEKKKNLWQRYQARVEKAQANSEIANAKYRAKFEATRFGARYTKITKKIDSLKVGKFVYGGILRGVVNLGLILLVMRILFVGIDAWMIAGYDYQLNQEQKDAGYVISEEQHFRSSTPDDVAARFFTDEESMSTPECEQNQHCWDFKVLPLVKSCLKVHVRMEFFESDDFFSQPVDVKEKSFTPESRGMFFAGAEYDLRLGSTNAKANYASLNRVYCEF